MTTMLGVIICAALYGVALGWEQIMRWLDLA
jgi:hypothetical protein